MRVVVVDQSRTMRLYVAGLLGARDHEAVALADGPAALAYLRDNPDIGALITSAELTGMSGMELCWETRLLAGRDRPIYVILMSSSIDKSKLGEALDSGADDFISKPPVPDELYARLRAAERFVTMQRELVRLANVDALTGVHNRRAFFEKAEQMENCEALAAIMRDIDHFKRINDVYGHDAGDRAITAVARTVADEGVMIGRLGGEEFAVLLGGASLEAAAALAERLRVRIGALCFETESGPKSLTCSFGVSARKGGETIDTLLKRADVALYAAKTGGRNRVVAADAVTTFTGSVHALAS